MPHARVQQRQDAFQVVARESAIAWIGLQPVGDFHDSRTQIRNATDPVDNAGIDGSLRHAVVERGLRILRQGYAADALDRLKPRRPIIAGTGKDNPDRPRPCRIGQRAHEMIDRHAQAARLRGRFHEQAMIDDGQVTVRGENVDLAGGDGHILVRLLHRQLRRPGKDICQLAVVVGRQVLQDHEAGGRIRRKLGNKTLQRFYAAGRRSDSHDRMVELRRGFFGRRFVHQISPKRRLPCSAAFSA